MSNLRPRGVDPFSIIETLSGISEGLGDWIAGPTPDNEITAAIQQRYREQCDSYSNAPSWMTQLAAPSRISMGNLCDPWLESQGSGGPEAATGQDFTENGGALIKYQQQRLNEGPKNFTSNVCSYYIGGSNDFDGWFPGHVELFYTVQRSTCECDVIENPVPMLPGSLEVIGPSSYTSCSTGTPPVDDPGPIAIPNPNPRPDPDLPPEDEPFEEPDGTVVVPMPRITNPWGDPIQLPNLPIPNPFQAAPEPGAGAGAGAGNPNVGPDPVPSDPIDATSDGNDDDFGDPPQGHIWVGFTVRVSPQGVSHGLWANAGDEPVYRDATGVARPVFDFNGDKVLGNPIPLTQELSSYWIETAGLPLSGVRVSILGSETYSIIPYSQPVEEPG